MKHEDSVDVSWKETLVFCQMRSHCYLQTIFSLMYHHTSCVQHSVYGLKSYSRTCKGNIVIRGLSSFGDLSPCNGVCWVISLSRGTRKSSGSLTASPHLYLIHLIAFWHFRACCVPASECRLASKRGKITEVSNYLHSTRFRMKEIQIQGVAFLQWRATVNSIANTFLCSVDWFNLYLRKYPL